jgi:23S rRNA (uracil1939-C5)-methyltransferase
LSAVPAPEEEGLVAALNHDAEGVVRSGKTVFLPGALPGERVRFRRRRPQKQFDYGELLGIVTPSQDRVTPRCAHFGTCGGCALQHLAPAAQLLVKEQELRETLQRVAQIEPERWLPPFTGPVWNYRRRARLGVKDVGKKGRVLVGFRERAKPYIADLARCEILAEPVGTLLEPLARLIEKLTVRAQLPQIEVAVADNATALVLRILQPLTASDRELLGEFAKAHAVEFLLQSGGPQTVTPLAGAGAPLYYRLDEFDVTLEFQPLDFVQVNAGLNALMIRQALDLLAAGPGDRVLDLFCGLGNFSLPLARRGAEVVGIEGDEGLVARARANAGRNALPNSSFYSADLSQPDPDARWWQGGFSQVLLDPPRAGAREVLPAIARLAPRRIVYVSCHPGTLARDLGELTQQHGYVVRAAGVLDMFPHTTHVESMAVLEPRRTPRDRIRSVA